MAGPALWIETTRGVCVETASEVRAAVVDREGAVRETFGPARKTPVRSTIKALQALPLLASGAADAAGVIEAELSLACASHSGENEHALAIENWLARIGHSANDLQCPPALPMIDEIAELFLSSGGAHTRARHNCSGKHAGFLTLGAHLRADPTDYLLRGGAVQQLVLRTISERCEVHLREEDIADDGCGAPTACMTLSALARGLATLLRPAPSSAEARLVQAMADHPWLVGGTYRFDTGMIQRTGGRVISKVGADGMHVALVRDPGLCVAVKSVSGTRIAAQVALVELLHRLDCLSDSEVAGLSHPVVRDDSGKQVGDVRIRA